MDKKIEELEKKVSEMTSVVLELKALVEKSVPRYQWEEKTTDSGIQLTGGPTTWTRTGYLKSVSAIQTPQGVSLAFILLDDKSGKIAILSPEYLKPL